MLGTQKEMRPSEMFKASSDVDQKDAEKNFFSSMSKYY